MTDSHTPDSLVDVLGRALGDKYRIERQLGKGGMGSVLLGRDLTLDRPVAIKVINPDLGLSAPARQRFLQEARTVARLNHPNITDVYAAGEVDGLLYFVMEYVPGESLRDLLDRDKRCTPERAAAILRDLASALASAHREGIIHRDLKPENVLLHGVTGQAKLTDFGVARAFRSVDERMTGTGMVVGTPRYMSPEQASGEREIDGRSDIYSLGLIGYEMFAGEPAFTGPTPASVIMKQITERPEPLVKRSSSVPPDIAAIIERALEKDPADRFQDAGELARALGGDATVMSNAPLSRSASHRRRRTGFIAAGAAVLAIVLAGLWLARGGTEVPRGVDPRKSVFVAPFENQTGDAGLAWLRDGSVNMLTLNLASWRDLNVVEYERSLDLLRDAELDTVSRIGLEDARAIARKAGVWTVVMGVITRNSDSLAVTARVYDVATGSRVRQAQQSIPASTDPRVLFDRLSRDLLELAGAPPVTPELARTTTASLDAYRSYLAGVRQLNEWKLDSADASFARAIISDSTFALAYHKRAQGRGWRPAFGDSTPLTFSRQAQKYAGRLSVRERGLIDAYVSLAEGLRFGYTGGGVTDTSLQRRRFEDAQQRYTALLARDSTDVEAWYGLGDSYFHAPSPTLPQLLKNWTQSLRAFNRTLALDSSFHLAYPHKIQIYTTAASSGSNVVMDGDSLVGFQTPQAAEAFGRPRIEQLRVAARQRVIQDARHWVDADPEALESHRALGDAYMAAGRFGEGASALRQAMQRPELAGSDLHFRIATLELLDGRGKEALATLRNALTEQPADSVRKKRTSQTFPAITGAASVAAFAGSIKDMEKTLDLAQTVEPALPFPPPHNRTSELTNYLNLINLLALGVDFREIRKPYDAALRRLDGEPGTLPNDVVQTRVFGPYYALVVGRDTSYLALMRKWNFEALLATPPMRAWLALYRGDTATAQGLATQFARGDSIKARATGGGAMLGAYVEAEVLEALGDLRGAAATLEGLNPTRYATYGLADPRWPLYARSFLARGRLYEAIGERAKAEANYRTFLDAWSGADPRLQPQVRAAQEGLNRLRDAPVTPLKKGG